MNALQTAFETVLEPQRSLVDAKLSQHWAYDEPPLLPARDPRFK